VRSSRPRRTPDAAELDASVGEPGQQLAGELGVSLLAETFLPGRAVRRPGRTPPVDELGRDRRGTDDAGQRIPLAEKEGGRRVGSLALVGAADGPPRRSASTASPPSRAAASSATMPERTVAPRSAARMPGWRSRAACTAVALVLSAYTGSVVANHTLPAVGSRPCTTGSAAATASVVLSSS
jgi:hypothetical protein